MERAYASYVGARFCVGVGSGTAALHVSLSALGVGPGDEVIVPALTFSGTAAAVLHAQGIPVFADICEDTYNIDARDAAHRITERTKAIVAVHLHGNPADMNALRELARRRSLALVEDAAQAVGSSYQGRKVGSLGDVACASIMPLKNLASVGEGGLLTTDSDDVHSIAVRMRSFGEDTTGPSGERVYDSKILGWNYRLSPFVAAVAKSQLSRLDEYNETRRASAKTISDALAQTSVFSPPIEQDRSRHVYHLYRFSIRTDILAPELPAHALRDAVKDTLLAEGIPTGQYQTVPVPEQTLFRARVGHGRGCPWTCPFGRRAPAEPDAFPQTQRVLDRTLVLFLHNPGALVTATKHMGLVAHAFQKMAENRKSIVARAAESVRRPGA